MSDSYFKHPGITSLDYKEGDNDASYSEYGDRTVSITIWIMDNALTILSHELGHVKYRYPTLKIIPNTIKRLMEHRTIKLTLGTTPVISAENVQHNLKKYFQEIIKTI